MPPLRVTSITTQRRALRAPSLRKTCGAPFYIGFTFTGRARVILLRVSTSAAVPALRVLVVEDELSIRQGLCDVLTFRGYKVEAVADGAAALEHALRQPFDLVLLDVMLPEVDGFTVCARIRARGREVPILMLTAKGSEEDILRGFELGADDYVTKPFSVRQ